MKKTYFFFLLLALMLKKNAHAVIMPNDSLYRVETTSSIMTNKSEKLSFFQRLVFKAGLKKVNKQIQEKKPINEVGLVAFIFFVGGVLLLLALPRIGLVFIFVAFVLGLISLMNTKKQNNIFSILTLILFILGLLIARVALDQS